MIPDSVFDQDGSWATITQLVKCTSWKITNGFPVPVKNPFNEEKGRLADHNLTVGQDNPSKECIVGDVPNVFDGSRADHSGPYDGVTMGVGC